MKATRPKRAGPSVVTLGRERTGWQRDASKTLRIASLNLKTEDCAVRPRSRFTSRTRETRPVRRSFRQRSRDEEIEWPSGHNLKRESGFPLRARFATKRDEQVVGGKKQDCPLTLSPPTVEALLWVVSLRGFATVIVHSAFAFWAELSGMTRFS